MKTTTTKTLLSSLVISGALAFVPVAAFAASATTTAQVNIGGNGIVRVTGAEVTSISGNLISAVTAFKNTVLNWTFATNASTTIAANNSLSANISDIHVGDKLRVAGTISAVNGTLNVAATKIRDVTSTASLKAKTGTVQSVNTSNGTFVLKSGDKLTTIQTNASTTFTLGSGATIAANTLANLPLNAKVSVAGVVSADQTSMTASKVILYLGADTKTHESEKDHDDKKSEKKENNGKNHGLKLGWFLNGKFDR
jgi:hypothetical protein